MRARPEPTQLECLSDASFLGKLLVLPANVRLDWKVIGRYKHSDLVGLIVSNEGKKFNNISTRAFFRRSNQASKVNKLRSKGRYVIQSNRQFVNFHFTKLTNFPSWGK